MWTCGYDIETLVIFNENAIIKKDTFVHKIFNTTDSDGYSIDHFDMIQLKLLFRDIKYSLNSDKND